MTAETQKRVAIISGGSRGLGRSLVEGLLATDHISVATFSRRKTEFVESLENHPELKSRFFFMEADQADWDGTKKFVNTAVEHFGQLDILINNAAVAREGLLPLFEDKQISELLHINLGSLIHLTKVCLRKMMVKKYGRILNISSIVGRSGYRGLSVYSASKAGIEGFSRSLAREVGTLGITVNCIAPGYLETDMTETLAENQMGQIIRRTPVGRLGTGQDVVPLTLYLCGEESSYVTGQTFVVDGGITV